MHQFEIFVFEKYRDRETRLGVIQGHWKYSIIFISNYGSILRHFEIFEFEKHCDLEIRVRCHSRSSKPVPFDSLSTLSY